MTKEPRAVDTDGDAQCFSEVLRAELNLIRKRRGEFANVEQPIPKDVMRDAQTVSALGVSFSGGGIRSATFNLGVAQGLAEKKMWRHVDYLSTVSGGGYIGTWLHGVVRSKQRETGADSSDAVFNAVDETLLSGVNRQPDPQAHDPIAFLRKYSNYLAPRTGLFSSDTWVIGVIWVRNVLLNQLILAPVVAIVAAAALLAVLVRQISFMDVGERGFNPVSALIAIVGFLAAVVVMGLNLRPIAQQSDSTDKEKEQDQKTDQRNEKKDAAEAAGKWKSESPAGRSVVILGVFAAAISVALGEFDPYSLPVVTLTGASLIGLMIVLQLSGGFVGCFDERHKKSRRLRTRPIRRFVGFLQIAWMSTVCGLVTTALVWFIWRTILWWKPWHVVAFGPALVSLCVMAGVMLLVGLMGADYHDAAREWTARTGSRFAMLAAAWAALFALTVDGPPFVAELVHRLPRVGPAAIATWLATTLGGVLAGRSSQTASGNGRNVTQRVMETLVAVAPTMFLIAYVIAIAAGAHALLAYAAPPSPAPTVTGATSERPRESGSATDRTRRDCCPCDPCADAEPPRGPSPYAVRYWQVLTRDDAQDRVNRVYAMAVLLGIFVIIAVVAATRININEFSLHHFYKNRLVRCYLGASRSKERKPNPFTGFDPRDDFPLASLSADPPVLEGPARQWPAYYGPYPIVNTTLNLNAGSELAQQERKAASFVFTPAYCGFERPTSDDDDAIARPSGMSKDGYRRTYGYSQPSGPNIGMTMAISGAAANPNWGYHTSGPVAFLLTVFNARLGWWMGNPRWVEESKQPGPVFALWYLIKELLGQTTGLTKFVNLSDGGHFENLGLYELVRRRCRFIIVCDSEEDGRLTFGSLGDAIRKCRADFGVEIDINPEPIRKNDKGLSTTHCVVGRIRYPEHEQAFSAGMTGGCEKPEAGKHSRGWILYLKSSLTGNEPADVIEYHSRFSEFPHQSTLDQFFSESQFESYRRLGYHVLRSAFEDIMTVDEREKNRREEKQTRERGERDELEKNCPEAQRDLVALFQDLTRKWYAPIPVTPEAASRLADAYTELMRKLAADETTNKLFTELESGEPSDYAKKELPPDMTAAVMAALQLMENVYTEFQFEHLFNVQNPRNAGWMTTFRKWAKSPILNQAWDKIHDDYHLGFQSFVKNLRQTDRSEPDVL